MSELQGRASLRANYRVTKSRTKGKIFILNMGGTIKHSRVTGRGSMRAIMGEASGNLTPNFSRENEYLGYSVVCMNLQGGGIVF